MKRLLSLLALAVPGLLLGQTPVTVLNPSFEQPVTATYTETPPTGWKAGGNLSVGVENVGAAACNGVNVAWINPGGSLGQDLGTQAAGTYTLTFCAGGNALSGLVASFGGCSQTFSGLTPTPTNETMTCTLSAAGDLSLSFADNSSQITLDNVAVTLTAPPPPPPVFKTYTWTFGLYQCSTCTPQGSSTGDWVALPAGSAFAGAQIQLFQVPTSGANQSVCIATLNANAQAQCLGPANVQPAVISLTYIVTSPAGTVLASGYTFTVPAISLLASPTNNAAVYLGFDSNGNPRFGFAGTS